MKELLKLITNLIARKFHGKIIISFQNGQIQPIVRQEETIKLEGGTL